MKTTLEQVAEFHSKFGCQTNNKPHIDDGELNQLRMDLMEEELMIELYDALWTRDKLATLDALLDLQYVLDGAFLALGFHRVKDRAFVEVHRSNMSKLGADGKPIVREDGKILKGPNYSPPNLQPFIEELERGEA